MRGEQSFEETLLFRAVLARETHERFLQRDRTPRVIARGLHVPHAVEIGLQLLLAAVPHLHELRTDACALNQQSRDILIRAPYSSADGGHCQPGLQQRAALLRLRAVTGRGVRDLVPQHRGQLGLAPQLGEQPAVHRDLAARQCPCVRHGVVEHREFVRELAIRHGGELLTHFVHVGRQLGHHLEIAALALARGRILLLADLQLLRFGHELDLTLAGDRIGAACGESEQQQ